MNIIRQSKHDLLRAFEQVLDSAADRLDAEPRPEIPTMKAEIVFQFDNWRINWRMNFDLNEPIPITREDRADWVKAGIREVVEHLRGLTGQDAYVLALLVQAPRMPKTDRNKLVATLSKPAKRLARDIVEGKRTKVAQAFRDWAANLRTR